MKDEMVQVFARIKTFAMSGRQGSGFRVLGLQGLGFFELMALGLEVEGF